MQKSRKRTPLPSTDDIIKFLKPVARTGNIFPDTDIYKELGLAGDDFHEMIDKFAALYAVDMTTYRWYFHADEEGLNIGSLFFKPSYSRVKRIPATPAMLAHFANKTKWDLTYPAHHIPSKRYDFLINRLLFLPVAVFVMAALLKKCSGG